MSSIYTQYEVLSYIYTEVTSAIILVGLNQAITSTQQVGIKIDNHVVRSTYC